jgi:hypothetical protein
VPLHESPFPSREKASGIPAPFGSRKVALLVIAQFELALVRLADCFGDAAWEVYVGSRNDEGVGEFFDVDNPIEGMISILNGFIVSGEVHEFLFVLADKTTAQPNSARRIAIANSSTSLAKMPMRSGRLRSRPLPTSVQVDSAARRADRRFRQLRWSLIGVVNVFAYKTVPSGT